MGRLFSRSNCLRWNAYPVALAARISRSNGFRWNAYPVALAARIKPIVDKFQLDLLCIFRRQSDVVCIPTRSVRTRM
jgi:hypothetical protein